MLALLDRPHPDLFWSAPLADDTDFNLEDPLALDYLGQQVGLWLFSGFTTRTSRAQNYAVVLYGLRLAEDAIAKYAYGGDDAKRIELFERWERFWALATLEYRGGQLERGDEDGMRGIRGAKRAWFAGDRPLPLDFPLISRQSELGGLGAYLSSLRACRLVVGGTLRPTPAAHEIIDAFWSERSEREKGHLFHEYALSALDLSKTKIPRTSGRCSLKGVGRRSRLSCLRHEKRSMQQERLWRALFLEAPDDSTLVLAERLVAATTDGVVDPESLLPDLLRGRWGALPESVAGTVELAWRFGHVAETLLTCFNRAYGYVDIRGIADGAAVASEAFPPAELEALTLAAERLLACRELGRFGALAFHGRPFVSLMREILSTDRDAALTRVLEFHRGVQRSRRGGGSWLRQDDDKLAVQVSGYNGYRGEAGFPGFKIGVVRSLLFDLGRCS
jgi:hypothetical protein